MGQYVSCFTENKTHQQTLTTLIKICQDIQQETVIIKKNIEQIVTKQDDLSDTQRDVLNKQEKSINLLLDIIQRLEKLDKLK